VATLDVIHGTVKCFQISDDVVNLVEVVLMFRAVNRTRHHFDVIEIFLDLIELMASVDLQNRVIKILKICNFPFHIHESVLVFHGVHGSCQLLQ